MAEESALDILKKYRAPAADAGEARDQAAMAAQMRSRAGLPEQSSFISDVLGRQFLGQGVLMGAGDEAEAAARSIARGTRYDDELAYVRQKNAITRAERPIASTAAEIAGGVVPAIGATVLSGGAAAPVAAARTAGLAGQIGRMAGTGAAVGGVQGGVEGFLKGEGGAAARLDKAAEGAVTGMALGGAVGAAFPAGAAAYRAVTRPPEQLAAGVLQRSLQQEGMTVDDLLRAYQQRQATGVKPEIASEVLPSGSALEAQARLVAQTPGAQRAGIGQQLMQRAEQQEMRLLEDFEQAIGQQKNMFATLDDLTATKELQARPLYQAVDPLPARTEKMDELLLRVPEDIFASVKRTAKIEGIKPRDIVMTTKDGQQVVGRDYTFADVDSIQRKLREAATRAFDDKNVTEGRSLVKLRDEIMAVADDLNPTYKKAREIYAGAEQAAVKMKEGQDIFKMRAEQIERDVSKMSQADKDAYLTGVMDRFNQILLGKPAGEDATRAFRKGTAKQQMEAAIRAAWNDPAEAKRITDNLFANIEREARMASSKNKLLGGSQTAQTLLQQESNLAAMGPLAAMAQEMAAGGPTVGMIGRAVQGVGQAVQKGLTPARQEAANEQLRKVLFARSEADLRRELEAMQAMLAARQYTAPTGARALVPGLLGGALNQ
jgi:GNAT superfamily N-acetyltransferase